MSSLVEGSSLPDVRDSQGWDEDGLAPLWALSKVEASEAPVNTIATSFEARLFDSST